MAGFEVAQLWGAWVLGAPGQAPRWRAEFGPEGVRAERLEGGRPLAFAVEVVTVEGARLGVLATHGDASRAASVVLRGAPATEAWLVAEGGREVAEARRVGAVPDELFGTWRLRRMDRDEAHEILAVTADAVAFVRGGDREDHAVLAVPQTDGCDLVAVRPGRDPVALRLTPAGADRWWAVELGGGRGYELTRADSGTEPAP